MTQRVLILGNPFSGARDNRPLIDRFIQSLTTRGLQPDTLYDRTQWEQRLHDPTHQYRCIIAAGGDGTLADVINLKPNSPLVMFPLGNENLFAKPFGYSINPEPMAELILRNHIKQIPLGDANGRRFTLMCSAGYDAAVVHEFTTWRTALGPNLLRRVKRSSYIPRMLKTALKYKHPTIQLRADGQLIHGKMILIFNLREYGLGLDFIPDQYIEQPNAPLLSYIVFKKGGAAQVMLDLINVIRGRHLRTKHVQIGQAQHIHLTYTDAFNPAPLQIDGDPAGFVPADINIIPDALKVLV